MDMNLEIAKLSNILEENERGTKIVTSNSDIIVVIAATGAGKSTFLHLINGHIMKVAGSNANNKISLNRSKEQVYPIGHTVSSETRNVRSCFPTESSTYYIDTPGLDDDLDAEIGIAALLTIHHVCSKANRIRFAVLINAHSLFQYETGSLNKYISFLKKVIGLNFRAHKEAFTFLFTHCNNAFNHISVNRLNNLKSEEKYSAIEYLRVRIRGQLSNISQGSEGFLKELADFCLNNYLGNYEILDPIMTDISSVRRSLECAFLGESSKKHFIQGSHNIVKTGLSRSSIYSLEKELDKAKINFIGTLEQNLHRILSGETKQKLKKEAMAICKIGCFIDRAKCKETVTEILEFLKNKSTNKINVLSANVHYLESLYDECDKYLKENKRTPLSTRYIWNICPPWWWLEVGWDSIYCL